jgi:hypothetical protein
MNATLPSHAVATSLERRLIISRMAGTSQQRPQKLAFDVPQAERIRGSSTARLVG